MKKVNNLLSSRFKAATEKLSKMTHLVEMSASGNLSSFSGVFQVTPLNESETQTLQALLEQYRADDTLDRHDLEHLSSITAEVKAINNQAIMLHGERIKKAQDILKNYQEGAFSAWLVATYGNRQTPYNFLQYYELHLNLPSHLHAKLSEMPRQAVYSLASREGPLEQKQLLVEGYRGQPKQELLSLIRDTFPLGESDKRASDMAEVTISCLQKLHKQLKSRRFHPSESQKTAITNLLKAIKSLL